MKDSIETPQDILERIKLETGHEPIEPANQYCKHCGAAFFITEQVTKRCKVNIIPYKGILR